MSAERLREAADRLDALAEGATEGPWRQMNTATEGAYIDAGPDTSIVARITTWLPDMPYIATMHPGVGKALAAWLRLSAEHDADRDGVVDRAALAVADAILGGAA